MLTLNLYVMTAILESSEYRNTNNDATIKVEKYFNKFSVALWRVVIRYDATSIAYALADGLRNKPTKSRIRTICNNF